MRDLSIAYGNGRTAKFWSNKTVLFILQKRQKNIRNCPKVSVMISRTRAALLPDICVITADRQIKWCAVPCWYMTLTTLKQSFCRTLAAKFPTRAAITPPTATPRSIRGRE